MNSIILIAACAVCLDQLFFRGRLASYVVDNLKGPKKRHTGHKAAPHTPKAGSAPRQTPEHSRVKILSVRTGADWSGHAAPPRQAETLYLPRLRKRSPRCRGGTPLSCGPRSAKTANSRSPKRPPAPDSPLPALPARAELRDAEVHAMLGELDFGEGAVMGDATAEERQAIANFDIRAYA